VNINRTFWDIQGRYFDTCCYSSWPFGFEARFHCGRWWFDFEIQIATVRLYIAFERTLTTVEERSV